MSEHSVVIPMQEARAWKPSGALRWLRQGWHHEPGELQQEWFCVETGEKRWDTVPFAIAPLAIL